MAKFLVVCVVGLCFAGATVVALGAAFGPSQSRRVAVDCGDFHFDRKAWLAPGADRVRDNKPNTSQRLAAALVKCDLLKGLREREVRAMLGRPYGPRQGPWMEYYLGASGFDFEYLDLRFKHHQVASSRVTRQ